MRKRPGKIQRELKGAIAAKNLRLAAIAAETGYSVNYVTRLLGGFNVSEKALLLIKRCIENAPSPKEVVA
jgi:AraC-like DNA-binding protein